MPRIDGSQSVQSQPSLQQDPPGKLGARQVRAGQSDLPRLDRIKGTEPPKGNLLTRHFEEVSTKMDRTSRSVDKHTKKLLDTLDRPAGKALDSKTLLTQIATLRNHFAQMSQLSGRPVDPGSTLQLAVAGRLGAMDNKDVLNVYRSFLSEDLTRLRSALEAETFRNPDNFVAQNSLEDLRFIEAMLMMEIGGRVARGNGDDVAPLQDRLAEQLRTEDHVSLIQFQSALRTDAAAQTGRLNDKHLEILVESGTRGANLHDRSMAGDASARLERKGFELSAHQVGDTLRAADLTANFNLWDFLGIGKPTAAIDSTDSMRNMFHWGANPSRNDVGVLKRDMAERQIFGSLERADLDADSRPTYGALNAGRESRGAASFYGTSFFVLKPEVKQRCTYTTDDTFNIPECRVTPEGLSKFDSKLPALLPALSHSARAFLAIASNVDKLKSALAQAGAFSLGKVEDRVRAGFGNPAELDTEDIDRLALLVQEAFVDRNATHARVAGYDSMENLLTQVEDDRLSRIVLSAQSPDKRDMGVGSYIEAQIHGRVAFDTDVQAMHVSVGDVKKAVEMSNGRFTEDAVRKKLADFCASNGVELAYYDPEDELIETALVDNAEHAQDFVRAHADPEVLRAVRDRALNAFLDPSNTAPNGFTGLLDSAARDMNVNAQTLDAADLDMAKGIFRRQMIQHSEGKGFRFDEHMAQDTAKQAIRNLLVKQPMLATVRNLDMPAPHKETFRAFVLASTLNSPAMLTSLHQATRPGVALMQKLVDVPSLSEAGPLELTMRELRDFLQGCQDALSSSWGRDDRMLYIDRALSLSASLFVKDGGQADQLYSRLTSAEVAVLSDALQIHGMAVDMASEALEESSANTRQIMADALNTLTFKAGREAGHSDMDIASAMEHELTATELEDVPQPIRQAMTALSLL